MNPVFYIGSGSGEIHLKMENDLSVDIKIGIIGPNYRYSHKTSVYSGQAEKVKVNGVDQPEFVNRHVTYTLLAELYELATGYKLKYGSIISSRYNIEKIQEIIKEVCPSLSIEFRPCETIKKINAPIEDQIFNYWMDKNV
ncbi:hypothetical protein [Erwinia phage FBB1]|nr:hypothetical protein [Erwinia phage FBB1]